MLLLCLSICTVEQDLQYKIDGVFECGPVYASNYSAPFADEMLQILQANKKDVKLAILHEAMQNILQNISASFEPGFEVTICDDVRKWQPVTTSFFCEIPE